MKKCVVLVMLLLSIVSCSTSEVENDKSESLEESQLKTERVFFKDWSHFAKEYQRISKLSNEEIFGENNFEFSINNDESRENLSPALNKFMNKNNEFQVGNEIMWFKDGDFYSFKTEDEKSLNDLKLNYKNMPVSGNIVTSKIDESKLEKKGLNNRVYLNPRGGINAKYQRQFRRKAYFDCGSTVNQGMPHRDQKYVHELYAESISSGYSYICSLYLRVKLEWNPSGGSWRFAGEKRTIAVNLSCATSYTTTTGSIVPSSYKSTMVNKTFNCSQNQNILLRSEVVGIAPPSSWVIDITGTIYQKINGDLEENAWTNSVNW